MSNDDYEEHDDNTLVFSSTEVDAFSPVDSSVRAFKRNESFFTTLERLKMLRDLANQGQCPETTSEQLSTLIQELEVML